MISFTTVISTIISLQFYLIKKTFWNITIPIVNIHYININKYRISPMYNTQFFPKILALTSKLRSAGNIWQLYETMHSFTKPMNTVYR